MTIIYRTNGPWGAGQGSNLAAAQVDGNFFDLDQQIAALTADHHNQFRSIDHISVDNNNNLFIFYTDGSSDGPFKLPVAAWNFTGPWIANTTYVGQRDLFEAEGGLYLVLVDSVSGSTFDPNATQSGGGNLYQLLLQIGIPATTYSSQNFTPALQDANSYIRLTGDGTHGGQHTVVFTVPLFSDVPFPLYTEFHIRDATVLGIGGVEVAWASGVTVNVPGPFTNLSAYQGATMYLKNYAQDAWDLGGGLLRSGA